MAGTSSTVSAKRSLSLDISTASKASDNSIKIWTIENNQEQNGTATITDLTNTASNADPDKSSPYVKRKVKVNGQQNVEDDNKKKELKPQISEVKLTWCDRFLTWRFVMVLLLQSSFVVAMFQRNCLPMAMVCMVRPRTSPSSSLSVNHGSYGTTNMTKRESDNDRHKFQQQESVFENVSFFRNNTHWAEDSDYEFHWNSEVEGMVLSSIMFSTFIGPMLMSFVKERLGDKWTLSICNLISSLLTFLSPVVARISPYGLVAIRIIMGISLGGNIPVIGDCVAWWAPQDEKLTMVALSFTGINIGNIMTSFVSGYLCLVPLDNGWPFVFYTFGTISLLWGFCWHFLSSHKPEEHPYISEKEKQYIISHRVGMDTPSGGKKVKPPYRKILTSVPVLAYLSTGSFHFWASYVLFTYLPVFFTKVMKFSVQETGLLMSLTSLFRLVGTFFWTTVGNKLASIIGIRRSRKICIFAGFVLAGVATIMIGFFDQSYKWVVLGLLLFVMIDQSVGTSTVTALSLDMAPRYAGVLSGMFVSIGSLISISGPLLTAAITTNGTHEEWRTVWIIMGSLFMAGALIFLLFGQASIQPWAQGQRANMPHIVSPFVSMGRRFSTFIEAPPLSPVTPMESAFEFSQNIKAPTTTVLGYLASLTPDIYYAGNFHFGKSNIQEEIVDKSEELEFSYQKEDDDVRQDDKKLEENIGEQSNQLKKGTYSEPGLEVFRSTADSQPKQSPFLEQSNNLAVKNASYAEEASYNGTAGTDNEAFEDSEAEHYSHSGDIQISRL